jgi:2-hydroxy-4-carboxymuconate semialdehyde hemiacetal dehydrogenase
MVAHTQRYYPGLRKARELVLTERLTVTAIVARIGFLRRENVGWSGYRRSWTDRLLWHHACHAVDTTLWLLGVDRPGMVEVVSLAARPDAETGTPLDLTLALRTPRDQLATVVGSYNSRLAVSDYWIVGREDALSYSEGVLRGADGVLFDPHKPSEAEADSLDSVSAQDRDFARAVTERGRPPVSADDVLPALEVLQRVQDAAPAEAEPPTATPQPQPQPQTRGA